MHTHVHDPLSLNNKIVTLSKLHKIFSLGMSYHAKLFYVSFIIQ